MTAALRAHHFYHLSIIIKTVMRHYNKHRSRMELINLHRDVVRVGRRWAATIEVKDTGNQKRFSAFAENLFLDHAGKMIVSG
jgi:hypothetical protein